MLVFVDEAGDTGRRINQGSSKFFVISLVLFEDHEEALACDQRISLLRRELKLPERFEFHFAHNSKRIRLKFLEAIRPYQFVYFCIVIDKNSKKLQGPEFDSKEAFYKYACQMLFVSASPYLDNAIVVLDKSGNTEFRRRLAKYLRKKMNTGGKKIIKKIKQQKSHSNNLLQLADYVSGIINRKVQNKKDKKDWKELYEFVSSREMWMKIWPK